DFYCQSYDSSLSIVLF
nr:immunoglobulin light chain junction region [Macaca mulatta]